MAKKLQSAVAFRTIYEARFHLFVRLVFESLFPRQTLVESFHFDAVSYALSQLLRSDAHRGLTINLPPRSLKSVITSTAFPLYALIQKRDIRILVLAGNHDLTAELIKNVETVLKSPRFLSLFGDVTYRRERSELLFAEGGAIQFQTYGLDIVGKGFDLCIIDDPQSPAAVKIKREREGTTSYFDASVLPRINDVNRGRIVLVQQRLHDGDLSSHVASRALWNVIAIPAISMRDETWRTDDGCAFRGKALPLCVERETLQQTFDRLISLGGDDFMAQYQQSPLSAEHSGTRGAIVYRRGPDGQISRAPSLMRVPSFDYVAEHVFGIDMGYSRVPPRDVPLDEWSLETQKQQAALIASAGEDRKKREKKREAENPDPPISRPKYNELYEHRPPIGPLRLVRR